MHDSPRPRLAGRQPHWTTSYRCEQGFRDRTFMTNHAYTPGPGDPRIVSYGVATAKPMDARDGRGKLIWPEDEKARAVMYIRGHELDQMVEDEMK